MSVILPKQVGTLEGKLLFQESEKVEDFEKAQEVVDSVKETLDYYGGVGLAAPQIGISKQIFIVDLNMIENPQEGIEPKFLTYINPQIIETSSEEDSDLEGCLSVIYGSLYGSVGRPRAVKVKYQNEEGEEQIVDIESPLHSRVIQHEYDHLRGKIFLQRMKPSDLSRLIWEEERDIRKRD